MSETDDDHQNLLDSVRSAVESHTVDAPEVVEDQPAIDMGEHVAAQIASEERQREEPKTRRDGRGRFAKADTETPDWSQHRAKAEYPTYAANWDGQAKADLDNASPALRAAIEKREYEIEQGFAQYRERTKQYEAIESTLAPRREAYQRFGFQDDAHAINHLFALNDQFEKAPAATILNIAQSLPPAEQQQLRQAFGGGGGYSEQQVNAFLEQRVQSLINEVQPIIAQREKAAAEAAVAAYKQAQARTTAKLKASNASLNGAPHGTPTTSLRPNGKANGTFGDYADDVRHAMNSLI